jgi:drug/metabolite transporter (DMT)-like permease
MKIVLVLFGMIIFTVAANLLLKTGAVSSGPAQGEISHLLNWRVILGLASFGLAACFYIVILQWVPLNVATSFAAGQYIAVILAAAWILSEPIGYSQWSGITLIALGIAIVGWSQPQP